MNGKQAKRLRRSAIVAHMRITRTVAEETAAAGGDVRLAVESIPSPHSIYRRAKTKLKRGY